MDSESGQFRIMLVDDEKDVLEFMSYNLKKENYQVYTCTNGEDAMTMARQVRPHLILLDIMMPGIDGVETCEQMKKMPELKNSVITFLTALGEDYSMIAGFEAGADDYIVKPIKPKVLVKKIKVLLKRSRDFGSNVDDGTVKKVISQDFVLDRERYVLVLKGKDIILPKKEFELLDLLISRPQKLFTREEIFHVVWGDKIVVGERTIDVHIRKLRGKIGDNYIQTIKGVGYKFVLPENE